MNFQQTTIKKLVNWLGHKYSTSLRIDLSSGADQEIFKWFLASILLGARISEKIALRTYREFEARDILTPNQIAETGWDGLVQILDEGGYARYDYKTATKLLDVMDRLKSKYQGSLNELHQVARDSRDLEIKVQNLGKGIGEVTVNIFLREMRGVWQKADPLPRKFVTLAAANLGFIKSESEREMWEKLESLWEENKLPNKDIVDFEVALLRLGKDYCAKHKCSQCLPEEHCQR